jgi:hypothetical protein
MLVIVLAASLYFALAVALGALLGVAMARRDFNRWWNGQ